MVVAIIFFYKKYLDKNNDVIVHNEVSVEQDYQGTILQEDSSVLHTKSDGEYKLTEYEFHQLCGFSKKKFHESMDNINYQSMSTSELDHIEKVLVNCQKWFENLAEISDSDINQIKLRIEEKDQILKELSIEKAYDSNIMIKATKLINHDDPDISGSALLYLLTYDNQFLIKIGEEMGTSDLSFLRGNLDLSILYSCQNGLDCSPEGVFMQDMCVIDESACNLTVNSWLRQKKTINQYDDLMISFSIINSLLNSDWFQDRDILNPPDP